MSIRFLTPILRTPDMKRSVAFYSDVLAFRCTQRGDLHSTVQRGVAQIMLAVPNDHEPWAGPKFTGSIYLSVDDVDAEWGRLKDRVRILYPIENFDYGMREFGILDDNGYHLAFGHAVAGA